MSLSEAALNVRHLAEETGQAAVQASASIEDMAKGATRGSPACGQDCGSGERDVGSS